MKNIVKITLIWDSTYNQYKQIPRFEFLGLL